MMKCSGLHMKCPIQGNVICQCCVRMWAAIPLAKDIDFSWALWYGMVWKVSQILSTDLPRLTRRCRLQYIAGHAVSIINTGQCRIKFVALTPMPINKYQCRSMQINTDQYGSMSTNADQCWIRGCLIRIY